LSILSFSSVVVFSKPYTCRYQEEEREREKRKEKERERDHDPV
jgi:hypothetical protein